MGLVTIGSYSPSHAQGSLTIRAKSHMWAGSVCLKQITIQQYRQTSISRLPMVSLKEIEGRLRLEYGKTVNSYHNNHHKEPFTEVILMRYSLSHGARGVSSQLRHRGKRRHTKGNEESQRKISISHYDSPKNRKMLITGTRIGRWESLY